MPRKKNPHSKPYIKPDYHSANKKQKSEQEIEIKKVKLRSSLDIYNRLMHDQTLNINLKSVFIGYTDHVLGDQEVCIEDWIMIDKGGDIPMHHIIYFTLKQTNGNNIIVWDRKMRLDRLFCSGFTNSQTQSLQHLLTYQQTLYNHNLHKSRKHKRKNDEMDSFIDYSKPTLAFDIDGTIVDIEYRQKIVSNEQKSKAKKQSNQKALNGEQYKYDQVIPVALAYLKYIQSTNEYNIIYISGRRFENLQHSMDWLETHDYPKGYVIHKKRSANYLKFKQAQLIKLKDRLNIIAYFGDVILDCISSIAAEIRPVLVVANEWVFVKNIYGGLESVLNCLQIKPSYLDMVKRSPFWGMSYLDLIPTQFATELFRNKDKNLLPPAVTLKCAQNASYLDDIFVETQQILNYHRQSEDNKGMTMATIENEKKETEIITNMPKEIFIDDEIMNKFFPRYPVTDDGFVESFEANDTDKWMQYLNKYGLVVLKVLSANKVDKTVNAMFDELYARTLELQQYKLRKIYRVDINDPFTWDSFNFPSPFGKFLTDRPAFAKQAFLNRCDSKIYFIWSTIFGQKNLQCTIDNWGIQRGSANLQFTDPETGKKMANCKEQIKWRRNLRPHWDVNPWKYCDNVESGNWMNLYQGALALSEQRLEDGTHLNLPGCSRFLNEWCAKNTKENVNPFRHNIDLNDDIIKYMQPIPLRKGEMVIWNFGQLHANTKNKSNRMRLSQYMRMLPCERKYIENDRRCAEQQMKKYKDDIDVEEIMGDMDDLSAKLLGFKEW